MNFVQPIRDPEIIDGIMKHLKEANRRDYILFVVGIYTGLRISDILKLKVGDLRGKDINIREKKTGKQKRFPINPALKRELTWYLHDKADGDFLIKSRQGGNKAIGRSMAYKLLNNVARQFGLKDIGTHTLRKTFGYHFYLMTKDIALLMDILNHSSEAITLRYIGINQDVIDKAMNKFRF